jgi:hypothetical protein
MNLLKNTPKPPNAKLMLGGLAGVPGVGAGWDFLENCLKLGLADCVDAIAYHPYSNLLPHGTITFFNADPMPAKAVECFKSVKAIVAKYTTKPMQYWLTEFGYATAGFPPWECVTEQQQADYWVATRNAYAAAGVDALFYFDLWEAGDPAIWWGGAAWAVNHMGCLHYDMSPKPIFRVFLAG